MQLGEWLCKAVGKDLRVDIGAWLGSGLDSAGVDHISVSCSDQTLVRLDGIRGKVGKQMQGEAGSERPILLIDLQAGLSQLDLSGLQEMSPLLASAIGRAGRASGTVRGRTTMSYWADISRKRMEPLGINVAADLDLEQAAVRIEGLLDKKAGERLRLAGSYTDQQGKGPAGHSYGNGSIEGAGFAGQGWYERSGAGAGPVQWAWGWLDVQDVARAAEILPAVAEAVRRDALAGEMTSRLEWSRRSDSFDLRTLFDLTGVQGTWVPAGIRKPAGMPARVDVLVSGPAGKNVSGQWRLPRADFALGESRAEIRDGEIEMAAAWAKSLAGQGREALGEIGRTWPLRGARAKVSGVAVFGGSPISQDVQALLRDLRAAGPVQWTVDWRYEAAKGLDFAANVEAQDLSVAAGGVEKAGGVPLRAEVKGRVQGSGFRVQEEGDTGQVTGDSRERQTRRQGDKETRGNDGRGQGTGDRGQQTTSDGGSTPADAAGVAAGAAARRESRAGESGAGENDGSQGPQDVAGVKVTVTEASGVFSDLTWKAQGQALCRLVSGQIDLQSATISGGGESRQLTSMAGVLPAMRPWRVQGHAAWEGTCTFEKGRGWRLEDADVGLWPVEWDLLGVPCRLEGMVNVQQVGAPGDGEGPAIQVATSGLAAKVGRTQGRVTVHGRNVGNRLDGEVGAAFEMIDVDELLALQRRVRGSETGDKETRRQGDKEQRQGTGFGVQGSETGDKETRRQGDKEQRQGTGESRETGNGSNDEDRVAGRGTRVELQQQDTSGGDGGGRAATQAASQRIDLAGSTIGFMGQTQGVRFTFEKGHDPIHLRMLSWEGALRSGEVKADLAGAFEGGGLTVQVSGRADGTGPVKVRYRADRAQPTELTRLLVERSFPGMRVDGPVTLEETLVIDPASKAPATPSSGEMIVEGGEVTGAAAPRAVQRLFPGLQLARFRFTRLHNWFEKDANGKTINRMIYRGSPWSLYMNGWSQADGTFRYEIGVDLLGPMESEYWATADRGRVPLFLKTGQVIDGRMHDEVIRYLNPQQILERILKDNLVTIAYEAVRQQVVGGKTAGAKAQLQQSDGSAQ